MGPGGSGIGGIVALAWAAGLLLVSCPALAQAPGGAAVPVAAEDAGSGLGLLQLALAIPAPLVLVVLWWLNIIRHGSFDGPRGIGRRDVSAWPWWFYLLCAATTFFVQGAGAGIGSGIGATGSGGDRALVHEAAVQFGASLAGAIAGLALLWLMGTRTPGPPRAHGFSPRPAGRALLGGLGGLALTLPVLYAIGLIAEIAYAVLTRRPIDPISHETLQTLSEQRDQPAAWLLAGAAVIPTPIVEELLFRAFLQSAMLRLVRRTWPAILITAVLFTGIHLGAGISREHLYALPTLLVLGIAMGIAYERTRNIWTSIVMHAAFNALNIALVLLASPDTPR